MDISIGLVNYNTRLYLEACLDSIFSQSTKYQVEVIMVDNASTDGSLEWVAEHYPQVNVIRNKVNAGVARGNNQAIKAAQGRYVFLLNTDTVLKPGAIDSQIEFLDDHPEVGAVGGKLIFEDGSFQSSYDSFPNIWMEFLGLTHLGHFFNPRFPSNPDCDDIKPVDWISSASLTIRKNAVEQVGYIDENYFIYGDETDLQFRLHQAGWKIYFLPYVKTVHFGGRSLNRWKRRRLVYRGKILYYYKIKKVGSAFLMRILVFLISILKLPFWGLVLLIPSKRIRAKRELHSILEMIKLSWTSYKTLDHEFDEIFRAAD